VSHQHSSLAFDEFKENRDQVIEACFEPMLNVLVNKRYGYESLDSSFVDSSATDKVVKITGRIKVSF